MMPASIHLHVVIHGMSGSPRHMSELVHSFARHGDTNPSTLDVLDTLVIESNAGDCAYDGIDWCAERALRELDAKMQTLTLQGSKVTRFSITGYSLGGLIARYVVGILHHRGFFDTVAAVNFTTFTTPHVGIPPYPYTSYLTSWIGSKCLARTGRQLYCIDKWSNTGKPLLEIISDKNLIFWKALSIFSHVNIYANAVNDVTVPYCSAAFEEHDPFANVDRYTIPEYEPNYEPILKALSSEKRSVGPLTRILPLTFDGPLIEWIFPWNLTLYMLLPVFVLVFVLYFPLRVLLVSRASRARILNMQAANSTSAKLIQQAPFVVPAIASPEASSMPSHVPLMAPNQRTMVRALNSLPNVKKFMVYISHVRNSHGVIICVNPRFKNHLRGKGVLRHFVDKFEM